MKLEPGGFRGYIASRPVRGVQFPQRVQNLIVRTHATRHGLTYKLSLAEYAMPECFMVLQTLLTELPKLDGVLLFSMFMLPQRRCERESIYARVLASKAELHASLEDVAIRTGADVALFEDTIQVAQALRRAPLQGRFAKSGRPYDASDRFAATLLATFNSPSQ